MLAADEARATAAAKMNEPVDSEKPSEPAPKYPLIAANTLVAMEVNNDAIMGSSQGTKTRNNKI
jgi:hypothetical protein